MSNTFEFVGTISPCKETENFKPYKTIWFDGSDWGKKSLMFNIHCGNNRHTVEIDDLITKDNSKRQIHTFTKGTVDSSGNRSKGESFIVEYKDRNKQSVLDKVAEFKKFIVDTETFGKRFKLEKVIDKFKDGSVTDEMMETLGVHSVEEAETALAESKKKRHEYICADDFIEYLNKFVNSDKIKGVKFQIKGEYNIEYNERDNKWYRKFFVNRIYKAPADAETMSQGTFITYFGENAIDDTNFSDTKKMTANVYVQQYLNKYKKNCLCPISLIIDGNGDEKAEKKALAIKKKFSANENEYKELGVTVDFVDGAQEVEITDDMLSEEQQENLELGLITMDDIKKELGKPVYGDRVKEIVITGLARGYSNGAKPTAYDEKDFALPNSSVTEKDDIDTDLDDIDLDI